MKTIHRWTALVLSLVLCLCAALPALAEETMQDALVNMLAQDAAKVVKNGDVDINMYKNVDWTGVFKAMPERFDLRDLGVVPDVRDQGSWGTCWGFASIAASETSILSELNMTLEEYEAKYGKELNLSEKHLAWFGTSHLPLLSDYPEGEYPYADMEAQAGEGIYYLNADEEGFAVHYKYGGVMAYASSIFASGIGPVTEELVPYAAADGSDSTAVDWSLDESLRAKYSFELENSSILPTPAQRDAEGNYVYSEAGTEAIKSELLSGRGVTIAYHADQAMDPEAYRTMVRDQFVQMGLDPTEENLDTYFAIHSGECTFADLPDEQLTFMAMIELIINAQQQEVSLADYSEEEIEEKLAEVKQILLQTSQPAQPTEEELAAAEAAAAAAQAEAEEAEVAARAMAEALGIDYDAYLQEKQRLIEANADVYINTANYAQYTDNVNAAVSHAVTIIGWDDNYSASNFLPGKQPPADGAWIVRNSWSADYGNDGYFYLSYYDQTITAPESFDFVVSDIDNRTSSVGIMGYDYMQTAAVSVVRMEDYVGLANIFTIDQDVVLSSISMMTADLNTNVSASVYLLNENATSPTDGTMLDIVTDTYLFGGYHRIALNYNYVIPAGSKISVVQMQRSEVDGEKVYNIPYTAATNEAYMKAQRIVEQDEAYQSNSWIEGRIGKGESLIQLDGEWMDWADVIAQLQSSSPAASYLSYDNLSMKLYVYPLTEIQQLHNLGNNHPFHGGEIEVCRDCGYAVVEP